MRPQLQPCFVLFDIVMLNDEPLISKPLRERKQLLDTVGTERRGTVVIAKTQTATTEAEFIRFANDCIDESQEGVVLKRADSVYKPDGRVKEGWCDPLPICPPPPLPTCVLLLTAQMTYATSHAIHNTCHIRTHAPPTTHHMLHTTHYILHATRHIQHTSNRLSAHHIFFLTPFSSAVAHLGALPPHKTIIITPRSISASITVSSIAPSPPSPPSPPLCLRQLVLAASCVIITHTSCLMRAPRCVGLLTLLLRTAMAGSSGSRSTPPAWPTRWTWSSLAGTMARASVAVR